MDWNIADDKAQLGVAAAADGGELIRRALADRGQAYIVVATGASQFDMLAALVNQPDIDWSKVTAFHLDEYVALPIYHPASFRLYLWRRFVARLPLPLRAFHYIDAQGDPEATCRQLGELIRRCTIDVAFIGIGENGHLAFNDPPADFETDRAYLVVELAEACRRQQVSEGWFETLDDVPTRAISMSIWQIMASAAIVCTVPDARKAPAVRDAIEGPVTPDVPASILQEHAGARLYLDRDSAALLGTQAARGPGEP